MGLLTALTSFLGALFGSVTGSAFSITDPKTGESVVVAGKGWSWGRMVNDRLTTTAQTLAAGGSLKYKNETQRPQRVLYVSLIPDSAFKTKGHVQVLINETSVFLPNKAGYFTDIGSKTIDFGDVGYELPAGKDLIIQTCSSDGTSVTLTVAAVVVQ